MPPKEPWLTFEVYGSFSSAAPATSAGSPAPIVADWAPSVRVRKPVAWLSESATFESVAEATQIQVRKEQAKAEEDYKAQIQQLVELDSKGYELLKLYGQEQDAIDLEKPAEESAAPVPEGAAAEMNLLYLADKFRRAAAAHPSTPLQTPVAP